MEPIASSRHIAADPRTVWEALSDVARWPEWLDTVRSVDRLDSGPLHVGSKARITQPKLPKALWEVTELVDGGLFTWESRAPGVLSIGRHEVAPEGEGSRVTLSIEWRGPLAPVLRLLWGRLTREYVEREGRCLAARVGAATR
jgi:carbon monoxide dehydrogenase subunit G